MESIFNMPVRDIAILGGLIIIIVLVIGAIILGKSGFFRDHKGIRVLIGIFVGLLPVWAALAWLLINGSSRHMLLELLSDIDLSKLAVDEIIGCVFYGLMMIVNLIVSVSTAVVHEEVYKILLSPFRYLLIDLFLLLLCWIAVWASRHSVTALYILGALIICGIGMLVVGPAKNVIIVLIEGK